MTEPKPSIEHIQQMQTEEWLRLADKAILAGRYLAADEFLQKVFSVDPENEIADSYQERIHFLIKQFSYRVGITKEVQAEVRKYRQMFLERRVNEMSSNLVKAQKSLESGHYEKAEVFVNRALSIDGENRYAKALQQQLKELKEKKGISPTETDSEAKFRSVIVESWSGGPPSEEQVSVIATVQNALGIGQGRRLALEREVKNTLYLNALREIWATGGLAAFSSGSVDTLRKKFGVSIVDHSALEAELLKEVRKNKVRGTVLLVDEDENLLLELARNLRLHSYAVLAAVSVEEAAEALKSVQPDAVICEVMFGSRPVGFELYELLRSPPAAQPALFLFLSASFDRITQLIGRRLGVDDFISKPVDYDMLFASLDGKVTRQAGIRRMKVNW